MWQDIGEDWAGVVVAPVFKHADVKCCKIVAKTEKAPRRTPSNPLF